MKRDKPSATAYLIAQSMLLSTRDPLIRPLIPAAAADFYTRVAAARSRVMAFLLPRQPFRFFARCLESMTVSGILLHYVLRKRFIEQRARRELDGGCRQVVVIGAGFDTLAFRLSRDYPSANFIELDHPATQKVKAQLVRRDGMARPNLAFHPLDLTRLEDGTSPFPARAYRTEARTLFIAEGLLMYLTSAEVDRLLGCLHRHSAEGSVLVCTVMVTDTAGRIAFHNSSRLVDAWLWLRGESFRFGIARERQADFFLERGFVLGETATADKLRQRYLTTEGLVRLPLASGEDICLARRA